MENKLEFFRIEEGEWHKEKFNFISFEISFTRDNRYGSLSNSYNKIQDDVLIHVASFCAEGFTTSSMLIFIS